jgi:probable rRNA maturation factor
MLEVDLDHSFEWRKDIDWQALAERAVAEAFSVSKHHALASAHVTLSTSISLSTNGEVQVLNAQWRQKDKPTNVLSFPMLNQAELDALIPFQVALVLLGDIILAHGVCCAEAAEKGIPFTDHITHLIVHGTLHLLGYDHIDDADAEHMESLEVKALASLGLPNPY